MVIFGQFNMEDVPFRDVLHPPGDPGRQGQAHVQVGGQRRRPGRHHRPLRRRRPPLHPGRCGHRDARPADARREAQAPRRPEINTSERFEQGRTFANKFWNVAAVRPDEPGRLRSGPLEPGRRSRSRTAGSSAGLDETIARDHRAAGSVPVRRGHQAAPRLHLGRFCDWYVEFVKGRLRDPELATDRPARACGRPRRALPVASSGHAVRDRAGLASPRPGLAPATGIPAPSPAESVCVAAWPSYPGLDRPRGRSATVGQWQEKIQAIRNLKAERNVPKEAKIAPDHRCEGLVGRPPAPGRSLHQEPDERGRGHDRPTVDRPADSAVAVLADAEVILPLEG